VYGEWTNGFQTEWKGERKYYCKNPAPALIDCLFYRLKHFSEFDSETAACSYIYSSCRTQQFHTSLSHSSCGRFNHSALFAPHCLTFFYGNILLFSFRRLPPLSVCPANVEGRFEKLLATRENSLVSDVSNWSCSLLHLFSFLAKSSRVHRCTHSPYHHYPPPPWCMSCLPSVHSSPLERLWATKIARHAELRFRRNLIYITYCFLVY